MIFLPFYCPLSELDTATRLNLQEKNVVVSFFQTKDEDTYFEHIQRIIYRNGDECCVVYIGFCATYISFMIQLSEQYVKTVSTFGEVDFEEKEFYLYPSISKQRIPFFTKLFFQESCEHNPHFLLEHSSAEMLCLQIYSAGEIKTEADYQKCIFRIMQIGHKLLLEYETAVESERNNTISTAIKAVIRAIFLNI